MENQTDEVKFEMHATRKATSWLSEQKVSFAFTTYQTGKLFLVGLGEDDKLSVFERTFNRCMGLCTSNDTRSLYMSSLYQLFRFEQAFEQGNAYQDYDRLYIPQLSWFTGDIDIHDIAVDKDDRLVFVNTLFSCLATVSDTHSFIPIWKPSFISRLAAEDRCHLNGMALDEDGEISYVTSVSQSDASDGWRDHRTDGGIVIDVKSDEIVAQGLSMPHSPRLYKNRLWLLNSGTGYFGYIDLNSGKFEEVAFCPGYMRGLAFVDNYAVVGLSQPRGNKTFEGLQLEDNLKAKDVNPRCGLEIIDLQTGDVVHGFRIEGIVEELYDVVTLPGVRKPMALGLKSDEIRHVITIGDE